jgi:recombination protein RecA
MMHEVTRMIRKHEKDNGMEPMPIVIVYDSIAASPCERELSETELPFDYTAGDWAKIVGRKEQPGERAKICSREFRKLSPMVAENDVCILVLNQVREKIGVMYGNPETTGGGGRALEFYASLRVRMQAKKKIEHTKLEKFAGINLSLKNVKNRTFRPFIEADDIKLYFDKGIAPLSGVLRCLLQDERIEMKGAGNYDVMEAYLPEGEEVYKFKAKKADNTVKKEVLLACPKLIGLETAEEVEAYLADFAGGMEAASSAEYEEKEVAFDIDGNPVEK